MKKPLLLIILSLTIISVYAWTPQGDKIMTRWGKSVSPENAWREYPRPQLKRAAWTNLNGLWQYAITDINAAAPAKYEGEILVPYAVESALSGVGRSVTPEQKLWYKTEFTVNPAWKGKNITLHFGAVDWSSVYWLNGKKVGEHVGGSDTFAFDITKFIKGSGKQTLVVAVTDPTCSGAQARGKQQLKPQGIWYTPVTGIWQTVWLEPTSTASVEKIVPVSNIDTKSVTLKTVFKGLKGDEKVVVNVYDNGKVVKTAEFAAKDRLDIAMPQAKLWTPETPKLYHFDMQLMRAGRELDKVSSYFALRKVSKEKDMFGRSRMALNKELVFQYGTLDQGWWPDGLLTPPSAEAMRWDMEALKDLGFNTIRKHIKVEPALYYYYADSMGIMLWQDMPSGFAVQEKEFSHVKATAEKDWNRGAESAAQWEKELKAMIDNLEFFPSITTWVVFNEGWGQYETQRVVNWTKQYEPSRLINGVSGWTDRKVGDMYDIHNYPITAMAPMSTIQDRIQVLGEFGGLGMPIEGHIWDPNMRNWGYKNFNQATVLLDDYNKLMYDLETLIAAGLSGAIYTQTTDVEGEVNGLITYDREVVKFPKQIMRIAHSRLYNAVPKREICLIADSRVAANSKNVAKGQKLTDKGLKFAATPMPATTGENKIISSRDTFTIDKMPEALSLFLNMSDSGKVWINGKLVMQNEGLRITRSYNQINLSDYIGFLKIGENVLEIENESKRPNIQFDYCLYAF